MALGRPRSGTVRVLAVIACLLLVTAGAPFALGAGLGDGTDDDSSGDSIAVDDDLPTDGPTVDVVVRLAEPTVPDDATDAETERRLETHAERTQEPVLEFAERRPGLAVEGTFWLTNAVVLEVDTERVDYEAFGRFDAVEAVHENFELSVPKPPTDGNETTAAAESTGTTNAAVSTASQGRTTSGVAQLRAPAVWDAYGTRGEGVRVAVLDTGVDADHPDIDLATDDPSDPTHPGGWAEFDETGQRVTGSTPHDTGTHGTHVSGTVAGGAASGTAIGVAPDAELLHGLVLNGTSGSFAQIVAGMEWAVTRDADVLSMSFGATGRHAALIDPVRNARDSGVVVVAAIGNEGPATSGTPGNVYDSIAVGAVDETGVVPPFSGGEWIARNEWGGAPDDWSAPSSYTVPDVVAPGVAVESAVSDGGYEALPGTSMATPHVSGTVALLLSIDPDATPDEIAATLSDTAGVPDEGAVESDAETVATRYGHGIVDAKAAADAIATVRGASRTTGDDANDTGTDDGSGFRPAPVFAGSVVLVAISLLLAVLARYRLDDT